MGNTALSGPPHNSPANSTAPSAPRNYHPDLCQCFLPQYGGSVQVDKLRKIVSKTCLVSAQEQPDFLAIVQQRMRLSHPNLCRYLGFQRIQSDSFLFCGASNRTYRLSYELYAYSLFNEIQQLCKVRQQLPEDQVCRIFEGVVNCLAYLMSQGTQHGDIKVGSIFLDEGRAVKLVDSFFLKEGRTSYEVVLEDPKSMSLLAPEQLELLRVKLFDSLEASQQYEMFTVGLSMIELTTIKEGMRCYNLDKLTINEDFFLHAMNDIQYCGYSYQLSNLIMNCVHKIPNRRPSYQQFLNAIAALRRHPPP